MLRASDICAIGASCGLFKISLYRLIGVCGYGAFICGLLHSGVGVPPKRHCERMRGNLAVGAFRYAGFPRSLRSHSDCALIAQAYDFFCINANSITSKISSFGNPCKQVFSLDIGAMTYGIFHSILRSGVGVPPSIIN